MKHHDIPPGAVVVGLDGSRHSDQALDWATRHALAESRPLVLVHAADRDATAARTILDTALARMEAEQYRGALQSLVCWEDPRSALLDASTDAATVVIGSRGRGPVRSLLLGSVSAAVAAHALCPVVVVRPHQQGRVRRGVLVGTDGTEASTPALEFAFRQAAEQDLPLTVAHVVHEQFVPARNPIDLDPDAAAYAPAALALAESLAGFGEKFPDVSVQRTLLRGTADAGLLALADTMHLVVVGHEPQNPISRTLLGSVALTVLEHASTVVAVVPPIRSLSQ